MTEPRKPRTWSEVLPYTLLPVRGLRDQSTRVTYLPWSDVELGLVGWELIPDRSTRQLPILVYVVPVINGGGFEIRCHVAADEPNPESDPLLGTVEIPNEFLSPG